MIRKEDNPNVFWCAFDKLLPYNTTVGPKEFKSDDDREEFPPPMKFTPPHVWSLVKCTRFTSND